MNYKIINDLEVLEEYVEFLPDLTEHEKYYVSLFARKKYNSDVKEDRCSMRRFLSDKSRLIQKIKQLEVPFGSYTSKGVVCPQNSLALYITPNPRCMKKASFATLRKLSSELENLNPGFNPQAAAMTCAHKSKSRSEFVLFDIDNKIELSSAGDKLDKIIQRDCYKIVETRGGFHIYVSPSKVKANKANKKSWHSQIIEALEIDQTGDLLTPVPGCVQGDFTPKLLN